MRTTSPPLPTIFSASTSVCLYVERDHGEKHGLVFVTECEGHIGTYNNELKFYRQGGDKSALVVGWLLLPVYCGVHGLSAADRSTGNWGNAQYPQPRLPAYLWETTKKILCVQRSWPTVIRERCSAREHGLWRNIVVSRSVE